MREPTIFWWPGTIKPAVVTGIGSNLDFLQTFAGLSGAAAPSDRPLDGYNLSPTLKQAAPSPRQTLYCYGGQLAAIRHGAYKLHLQVPGGGAASPVGRAGAAGRAGGVPGAPSPAAATGPVMELYNLDEDPRRNSTSQLRARRWWPN